MSNEPDQDSQGTTPVALDIESARSLGALIASAMTDDEAWQCLPVPVRALVAAVALSAAGRRVNKRLLAQVGKYSRTTAERSGGWSAEIAEIVREAPARTSEILSRAPDQEDPMALRVELDEANRRLAETRERLAEREAEMEPLVTYTAGLVRELRRFREDERAEQDSKILYMVPSDSEPEQT